MHLKLDCMQFPLLAFRLLFGTTQYFVYANPREAQLASTPFPEVTFEMAQEEIAKKSGFDMSSENKSKGKKTLYPTFTGFTGQGVLSQVKRFFSFLFL